MSSFPVPRCLRAAIPGAVLLALVAATAAQRFPDDTFGIFGGKATLQRNCRQAQENNLCHAVIIGIQTHALPANIKSLAAADFRYYQWRKDG